MTLLYLHGFLPETPREVAFWPPLFRFSQTDQPCNSGCFARFVQCLEHCNLPHHGKGTSSKFTWYLILWFPHSHLSTKDCSDSFANDRARQGQERWHLLLITVVLAWHARCTDNRIDTPGWSFSKIFFTSVSPMHHYGESMTNSRQGSVHVP